MSPSRLTDPFFIELYNRTSRIPDKSKRDSIWVKINTDGCKKDFINKLNDMLDDNGNLFKLHIRGIDYYVELFSADSHLEAYMKAEIR